MRVSQVLDIEKRLCFLLSHGAVRHPCACALAVTLLCAPCLCLCGCADPPTLLPLALLQVVSTKNATDDEGNANRVLGGATGGQPEGAAALRAPGVLQAWSSSSSRSATAGGGWSWRAWEPEPLNLLGTLQPTPSADLAGCCSNPNASAGEYDTKAAYALQASTCPTTRRPPPPPGPRGGAYARR